MSDTTQEISTDYVNDDELKVNDDPVDPLAGLNDEMAETQELDQELEKLLGVTMALEQYGATRGSFGLLKSTELLSGTTLASLGVEHFQHATPDSPESRMAVESLGAKIAEKVASWAAKILSVIKNATTKTLDILSTLKNKISETGKALISGAWDKTKAAGRTMKAHPFATAAAVLTAAGVVAGIVVMASRPGAYANESALRSMIYKIQDSINSIKWPFGKVSGSVIEGTATAVGKGAAKVDVVMEAGEAAAAATAETAAKLGWTQSAVKAILARINQIWDSMKTGLSSMAAPIIAAAKKANDLGEKIPDAVRDKVAEKTKSNLAGWAAKTWVNKIMGTMLFAVIAVIVKLIKNIAIKAFQIVNQAFAGLKGETTQTAQAA